MNEQLTVVIGFRDRDTSRLRRCFDSLERQSYTDFRVLLVDYGSTTSIAREIRSLVERYAFCEYIYNETRGYEWNRSHALNTGGRLVHSPFIMTTDADMIFAADFLEIAMSLANRSKVLYCTTLLLPSNFSDWQKLESYAGGFRSTTKDALGGCQLVATDIFHDIRGFDEYYRYWGREDRDTYERLLAVGLQAEWLNDQTSMYHQWHPERNFKTQGFMPESVWGSMQMHFWRHKQQPLRNDEDWGRLFNVDDRPVFSFLDFAQNALRLNKNFLLFDEDPADIASIGKLTRQFWQLPAGHALGINHAFYPKRGRSMSSFMRYANYALKRLGVSVRLAYGQNHLHTFLVEFIENNQDIISDYYLDFPTHDGVSVLIRA